MFEDKKDLKKWIILIFVAMVMYFLFNNFNIVTSFFQKILNITFPFILGGCIAFILNIPMSFFERKLYSIFCNKKKKKRKNESKVATINNQKNLDKNSNVKTVANCNKNKTFRVISMILAFIVILLVIFIIVNLILPELINIIKLLIQNIPYYSKEIEEFIARHSEKIPDLNNILKNKVNIEEIKNQLMNKIPNLLTSSISIVGSIVSGIVNSFIAIIFAVYILFSKEKLQEQVLKLIYSYLNEKRADKIVNIAKIAKVTFTKFFTVQCLEASILGSLCIIGMLILRVPYAVPIGILIGVTALIPVVGAFIGVVIGAILIFSVSPIKVVTFIIFVLILQQIEGNVIYPRVVGTSVGLPGMWVLVAVTIGGSLGGIIGMLISVPVASVIYTLLKADVKNKLKSKNISKDKINMEG